MTNNTNLEQIRQRLSLQILQVTPYCGAEATELADRLMLMLTDPQGSKRRLAPFKAELRAKLNPTDPFFGRL